MVFGGAFAVVGKFRLGPKCYLVMARSVQQQHDRTLNWRQLAFF